jgi:hypothetical protein
LASDRFDETVSLPHDTRLKRIAGNFLSSGPDEEIAMNTIVAKALMREAAKAETDVHFLTIALFCGVGLLVSLCCMLSFGFDISAGLF